MNISKSPGNLFIYILDRNEDKSAIVDSIEDKFKLDPFSAMPKRSFSEPGRKDINDCVFPPVEEWIRGFIDAEFVITDSFHGTVFSIIFNKPFISIANKSRGLTRFESLLNLFGLSERLILNYSIIQLEKMISQEIEWDNVNRILKDEQNKALNFLASHLH